LKHANTPAPSEIVGKKVALLEIEGEESAKKIIEVALINQLVQKGAFVLIAKSEIEQARHQPNQNPLDWLGLAKRVGADIALKIHVQDFQANTHESYSTRDVYDSQIAAEQGTDGKTQQVFKVKSMDAHVRFALTFTPVLGDSPKTYIADKQEHLEASAQDTSIHLPPTLRLLEKLSNDALTNVFNEELQ
jgi:hypothetical protein